MSNDDLTQNLSATNEDDRSTSPTITAVFRLLQDVDKRVSGRFEGLENRIGGVETRLEAVETRLGVVETRLDRLDIWLAREFASIDGRFIELANEMKNGFIQFSDKLADQMDQTRLHRAADYDDLLRRMRRLESKSS